MSKILPLADSLMLAQAAPAGAQGAGMMNILMIVFMLGAFYFLMIAPQRKKQKEHDKMLAALKSGDEIVTNGGLYGTITNVKEDRFVIRVADSTKLEVGKGFINTVVKKADSGDEPTK